MTEKYVRWTEVLDYDAAAIRKLLAVEDRANLARLAHNGAAYDLVPATKAGHRAKVR